MKDDPRQTRQGAHSGRDVVLGHAAECDGIEEYDNALPTWWLGLFYACIAWGVGYATYYHFIGHRSEAGDYDAEIAAANLRWPPPKAGPLDLSPAAVASGEAVFMQNCIACHGKDLHGGIGPDLLDTTWIHGGKPEDILKTASEGVLAKGMPPWGKILGPEKVALAAAFVYARNQEATKGMPATDASAPAAPAPAAAPPAAPAPEGTPQ